MLTWKLPSLKAGEGKQVGYEVAHQENGDATTTAQLLIGGSIVATKTATVQVAENTPFAAGVWQAGGQPGDG